MSEENGNGEVKVEISSIEEKEEKCEVDKIWIDIYNRKHE